MKHPPKIPAMFDIQAPITSESKLPWSKFRAVLQGDSWCFVKGICETPKMYSSSWSSTNCHLKMRKYGNTILLIIFRGNLLKILATGSCGHLFKTSSQSSQRFPLQVLLNESLGPWCRGRPWSLIWAFVNWGDTSTLNFYGEHDDLLWWPIII